MSRIVLESINQNVKQASYAVRGSIVTRSMELAKQLKNNASLPFDSIISCNIGNPHVLQQKPLSYIRDVLSIVVNPSLTEKVQFSPDILKRARKYLDSIPCVGAYTESQGILAVREEICQFLLERDGFEALPENIFLTNGASEGVRLTMQTILRSPDSGFKDGILTPIPQYPLYSALTTLLQGNLIPYYLDESNEWSCTTENLTKALEEARKSNICVRGLVVINPGNPTGQVLPEATIKAIVSWCKENEILLLADEVYQENIWKNGAKFVSFRKVAMEANAFDGETPLQMISFHSISKGFLGECGLRGGYFEMNGIPVDVRQQIYKLCSISLCSNTIGQIATGIMCQPPKIGEESYTLYVNERDQILSSLKKRAELLTTELNKLEGVSCNSIDGAMYAFPTITLPTKAVEAATEKGIPADEFYSMELLENTGIVVVPGSGFGQVDGTFHFRTTILPPEDKLNDVVQRLSRFHRAFLGKYN